MTQRNNAPKTRGIPFKPGNPGRPKGSRHKTTVAMEALLDGEGEKLTRKAIDLAMGGDVTALRLCIERLVPARRDSPVTFTVGDIASVSDAHAAMAQVIKAVGEGELTPDEGGRVMGLILSYQKSLETADLERRLAALEQAR